jgi:SH3-like domain-containing protein
MRHFLHILFLLLIFGSSVAWAERLAVSAPTANIRSGPGTGHDILWRVERYYPLSTIEKSGSWYYFSDFEGDTGWIHRSLVSRIPTVITVKDKSNIRSGPGTKFKILSSIDKGIPFKVIKRKGNWVHVVHGDGDKGWIYGSLLW